MEPSSLSTNYGDILTDLITDTANQIRRNAIIDKFNGDIEIAQGVASDLTENIILNSGWMPDMTLPENSTLSFHV